MASPGTPFARPMRNEPLVAGEVKLEKVPFTVRVLPSSVAVTLPMDSMTSARLVASNGAGSSSASYVAANAGVASNKAAQRISGKRRDMRLFLLTDGIYVERGGSFTPRTSRR